MNETTDIRDLWADTIRAKFDLPVGVEDELVDACMDYTGADLMRIGAQTHLQLLETEFGGPLKYEGLDDDERAVWRLDRPARVIALPGGVLDCEEGAG